MDALVLPDLSYGWELYDSGRYAEAVAFFRDALHNNPTLPAAYKGIGRALVAQQRFNDAIKQYRKVHKLYRDHDPIVYRNIMEDWIAALHNWGDSLRDNADFINAANKYNQALELNPDDRVTYEKFDEIILALADAQRVDEAINICKRASEIGRKAAAPNRKVALRFWGDVLRRQERFEGAAAKYQEALTVDADDADTYERYGDLAGELAERRRFAEADKLYQQACDVGQEAGAPNRKVILRRWGEALAFQGRFDEAADKHQAALSVDPNDADTYKGYDSVARELAEKRGFAEADKLFRQVYEIGKAADAPNRRVILRHWGDALSQQERFDEAAAKYQEALGIDPDDPDTYWGYWDLAVALADKRRFAEANELLQQAYEVGQKASAPNRKVILRRWGGALSKQKRFDEAAAKYQAALDADPDDHTTYGSYSDLARVLVDELRFDEAFEIYRKVDALYENARELSEADKSRSRKYVLSNWGDSLLWRKLPAQAAAKYAEAQRSEPDYPNAYYGIGLTRADQEDFEGAIEQYGKADELWRKQGSTTPGFVLRSWANALTSLESFEEAVQKSELAVKADPHEAWTYFDFGNVLSGCGRYKEAIDQLDRAISIDPDHPYFHHNKAAFLFSLGNYQEGWAEWHTAWDRYVARLRKGPTNREAVEQESEFANLLRGIFTEYSSAEQYYKQALSKQHDKASVWSGLATLYAQWADTADPPADIQARLSHAVLRARELLEKRADKFRPLQALLSLADVHIETRDWIEAKKYLERAEALSGEFRLRHAEIASRLGLIHFRTERYDDAVENFRRALLVTPYDLTLRGNLGKALLRLKRFDAAEAEFDRVLRSAEGNVEARLGAAQVCVELADDGDPDRYDRAEEHLTRAIEFGRNQEAGSKRLQGSELADVYYLRGYARVKRYGKDPLLARLATPLSPLHRALRDFQRCKQEDPNHLKAAAAIERITKQFRQQRGEVLTEIIGPFLIFLAGLGVFVLTQADFFFRGTAAHQMMGLPDASLMGGVGYYVVATFGALLFMVAGLYLPKVLKLKVGVIELQKTSVEQVSAASSLDIGRFTGFK